MKTIQLKLKTLMVVLLIGTFLLSSTPLFAQSLEGKWNIAKMNTRQSRVIEFTKDSAVFYEFDQRQVAKPYQVEGNHLIIDTLSFGALEFVTPHRLRLKPEQAKSPIDFVRLKSTKTTLTRPEIEQLKFKVTYQNHPLTINFDGEEDDSGQIIQLEKIDSTYFLSFYRNDKRMGAMPIEQVSTKEIVVYGFPKEPFAVSGKRVVSNTKAAKTNNASDSKKQDPTEAIVGKWFYKRIQGRPPLSDCTKKTFFQFSEDSSIQTKPYAANRSNGNCVAGSGISGTYEVLGDDQIEVTQNGATTSWKIKSLTKTKLVVERDGRSLTLTKE